MPGSGKSTYYEENLLKMNYTYISQDLLKTRQKVLSTLKNSMLQKDNIVIDSTNPTQEKREEYYNLAKKYSYNITVLYFVRNGKDWNKLRDKPVPNVVYSVYFKNLIEPTKNNTPGNLYQIMLSMRL